MPLIDNYYTLAQNLIFSQASSDSKDLIVTLNSFFSKTVDTNDYHRADLLPKLEKAVIQILDYFVASKFADIKTTLVDKWKSYNFHFDSSTTISNIPYEDFKDLLGTRLAETILNLKVYQ